MPVPDLTPAHRQPSPLARASPVGRAPLARDAGAHDALAGRTIVIATAGSRGDVQPYIALGLGLLRAGARVRIATHETFRPVVTAHGLLFTPLAGDPRAILGSAHADRWLASGRRRNILAFARELRQLAGPMFEAQLADYEHACTGADLLLCNAVSAPAWLVARARGIPVIAAYLQPLTPTRRFPAVGVPARTLGPSLNLATHLVAESMLWRPLHARMQRWQQESLGVARPGAHSLAVAMRRAGTPVLYGYSASVVPRPADWGRETHVTGYWTLPLPDEYVPPPALTRFLADGPPPVCIGFGSMTPANAERMTATLLEALARAGQRGVLVQGWGTLGAGALPSWAIGAADVPHEWLLPQTAAVVHHGGAGTTGAGLRSGAPSIVVPLGFDQPFWGARVHALGVGPRPIARRSLTAAALAHAIGEAMNDEMMRERARTMAALLRAEDGVGAAASAIADVVTRSARPAAKGAACG